MAARLCLTISVLLLSQLAFAQKPDPLTTFCTFEDGKEISIPCGFQQWKKSRGPLLAGKLAQFPDEPTAATFA